MEQKEQQSNRRADRMTEQNTSCLCSRVDLMKQSEGVCLSEVHTLCSWEGAMGSLLTLFYYYILTFLILPDSTETWWLENLDCFLFLELTKMTSNFTVLSK